MHCIDVMRAYLFSFAMFAVAAVWVGCSTGNGDITPDYMGTGGSAGGGGGPLAVAGAGGGGMGGGEPVGGAGGDCYPSIAGNQHLIVYSQPGCGAQEPAPICIGAMGACAQAACGCDGKIIIGCTVFLAPYAYAMETTSWPPPAGTACDPSASGGAGGHAPGTGGAL
jgi:hypothetical protein